MKRLADVGERMHRMIVIGHLGTNPKGARILAVRCDCGTETTIANSAFLYGRNKSCGCWRRERTGRMNLRHGEARVDGAAQTPEYAAWRSMIARCESRTWRDFPNYGGRGIRVCDRWRHSFDAFVSDVGRRPSSTHSLDRIDVDGNYESGNVRWATLEEQANNKRNTLRLTVRGETKTATEWMRIAGLTRRALDARIASGWTPEQIVDTPLRITSLTRAEYRSRK